MSIEALLCTLSDIGASIALVEGNIKISSPPNTLTKDIIDQIKEIKPALLTWLKSDRQEYNLPKLIPDILNHYTPFNMSDLQQGFYIGKNEFMEFNVRPHYYMENDVISLDVSRYIDAWNKALIRHNKEFVKVNKDGKLQSISNIGEIDIKVYDITNLDSIETKKYLEDIREKNMRKEPEINAWPWFDISVTKWNSISQNIYRIHINNNNFYSDGFGTGRLLEEVDTYYKNIEHKLPEIELSYRDAIVWLEEVQNSELGQKAKSYWLDRIDLLPPAPELPLKHGTNKRARSKLVRHELTLSKEQWTNFKLHASRNSLTPTSALIAVYAEVISAYSNSEHFILSNMMTRRMSSHPQMYELLGNFASLYPLEVDFRNGTSFAERAKKIQSQSLKDNAHIHFGGMQVMQALNRKLSEFGTSPAPYVVSSGLFMDGYKKNDFGCLETSQTLMDHQFFQVFDGSMYCVFDVIDEHFCEGVIDSFLMSHKTLMEELCCAEKNWNNEKFDLICKNDLIARASINTKITSKVPEGLLHDFLHNSARDYHSNVAIKCDTDIISYADLRDKADKLTRIIKSEPGELVAVMMPRTPMLVASVFAILKRGSAYIPVSQDLPNDRVNYLLSNSNAKTIIVSKEASNKFEFPENIEVIVIDNFDKLDNKIFLKDKTISQDSLAYVIYTSGSTGNPKGVMVDHLGALNTILDINSKYKVIDKDRIFGVSSFGFDLSVYDIFGAVHAGATLVYPNPEMGLNAGYWVKLLLTEKITIWNSAPPLMSLLVDNAKRQGAVFNDLRLVMLSGDWIPVDLPREIRKIAPNAHIVSLGGATEASIWSIYYDIDEVDVNRVSIPYGYPMRNQGWMILDYADRPVPNMVAGDLYITGIGLAKGYLNDSEKTGKSFLKHPITHQRIYKTGDIGRYLPDGCIEFLGRSDFQVKIQGHRIELGEIESVLIANNNVKEAIITAHTDSRNTRSLVAYVVLYDSSKADDQELKSYLSEKLPAYMIPNKWMYLNSLPLSSNGKIDRSKLPQFEEINSLFNIREKVRPTNLIEAGIALIWEEVLNISDISIEDDFFEIGGQSFDAIRIAGMIEEKYECIISLGNFWTERTIKGLSIIVDKNRSTSQAEIVKLNNIDNGKPIFFIHPAGGQATVYSKLASELNIPAYAIQAARVKNENHIKIPIEWFSSQYLPLIKSIQPDGEFTLAGWSSGAIIAFDIAASIESAGGTIDHLFIFDSPAPHNSGDAPNLLSIAKWFIEDLGISIDQKYIDSLDLHSSTNNSDIVDKIISHINSSSATNITLQRNFILPLYEIFNNVVNAVFKYNPAHTLKTEITLIRASNGVVSEFKVHPCFDQEYWGWDMVSSRDVNIVFLDETHHSLISGKSITILSEIIN